MNPLLSVHVVGKETPEWHPALVNVLRVPTWPNHTSVPDTHLHAYNSTAQGTDELQGHVPLERTK